MADITRLLQFTSGLDRGVDLTSNNLVTLTVTVGGVSGTTLSQTILNNLINLQNGTDFSTGTNSHTHDGRYWTQTVLASHAAATTSGAYLVGVYHTPVNYSTAGATVEQHLTGLDTALSTVSGSAITSVTGDVTGTGPGAAATTVAKIQGTTVSGTTGTGNVVFSASPTLTGTIAAAAMTLSSTLVATGAISGSNLTSGGHASSDLALAGGTMSGNIAMGGNLISGLGAPTANGQALRYDQLGAATSGSTPGIATLDSSGKIPVAQLPSAVFIYQGTWNPNTNTPTLHDASGGLAPSGAVTGWVYWVSAAYSGTVSGLTNTSMTNFNIGDLVVYNGSQWELTTPAAGVTSVNSSTGAVTINAINQLSGDVTTSAASGSQSEAATVAKIQGTTVSGTTGTGNVMFSASPTTTGTLTAAAISASGAISGSNLSGTNTGDQTITLTGDVTGSGTGSFAATIGAGAVTATKLGSVTDGVTLDQSASGSKLEIKSGGVGATQLGTGAFDGATITGGGGTAAAVQNAPQVKTTQTAGQAFSANTTYVVRWAQPGNGETAGQVYAADQNATSNTNYIGIGLMNSTSAVSASGSVKVVSSGNIALGSSDTPFSSGQVGLPVYLTSSGAWSTTAPTTTNYASYQIGIVSSTTSIWVLPQFNGIN